MSPRRLSAVGGTTHTTPRKKSDLRPNETPSESDPPDADSAPSWVAWIAESGPDGGTQGAHGPVTATPIPPALLYTIPNVIALLQISRAQVFTEMRRGRLKSVTIGRARRVPAQALTEYVNLLIAEAQENAA
ncbi:MAG: DNA-binding protein [Actinomycetia bacterium]|nr:DNA-binding protein [Actinomycetes bacterium]